VMTKKEVEAVRARAKAKNNGPWVTDWVPMALKTVFKRAMTFAPKTDDLAKALHYDTLAERADQDLVKDADIQVVHPDDPDNEPPESKTEQMAAKGKEEEKVIDAEFETEPSDEENKSPVDMKAVEIVAKIQHELTEREIGESLFFKWMGQLGMDKNKDLILNAPADLEKLLAKCQSFK